MLDWSSCPAVERDADRVSGAWVFRGTRVPVAALFENLEDGALASQFVDWFPGVTLDQVRAVLEHVARSATDSSLSARTRPPRGPVRRELLVTPIESTELRAGSSDRAPDAQYKYSLLAYDVEDVMAGTRKEDSPDGSATASGEADPNKRGFRELLDGDIQLLTEQACCGRSVARHHPVDLVDLACQRRPSS